jgi:hypothetical protein
MRSVVRNDKKRLLVRGKNPYPLHAALANSFRFCGGNLMTNEWQELGDFMREIKELKRKKDNRELAFWIVLLILSIIADMLVRILL